MFESAPRTRRHPWLAPVATTAALALAVGLGVTPATRAHADPPPGVTAPDEARDPALERELARSLDGIAARLDRELQARIESQTRETMSRAIEQEMSAVEREGAQNLATRRAAQQRAADRADMETITVYANRDEAAPAAAARRARIASGSLELGDQPDPEGERVEQGHHRFDEPFVAPPKLALGMRVDDSPQRVAIRVVRVDERGFDYELRTWGEEPVRNLRADWVAYAQGDTQAPPASAR